MTSARMRSGALILHPGALGDVLLALPILRRLAESEGGPLTVAARSGLASLLGLAPFIDIALDEDALGLHRLFGGDAPPVRRDRLRDLLLASRRIVAFYADAEGELRRGLGRWGAEEVTVSSHKPPAGFPGHVQDHLARCLLGEESSNPEPAPTLVLPEPAGGDTSRGGRGFIAIHPGSGSPAKNWPVEAFEEVARRLEAAGERVAWILGPAEETLRPTGQVLRPRSLVDLARAIGSSRAYVGNDSGPTHLATALGVPAVALFGPTSPALWAPRGPRVRVLCPIAGGPAIQPGDVVAALADFPG